MIKTCKYCKNEFITRRSVTKYCNVDCANKSKIVPVISNAFCAQCDKPIYRSLSSLKGSKSGLYFCSKACKCEAQRIGGIKEIMPPHYGTTTTDYRSLFKTEELICARCNYDEFDCSVEIHHIDKDRKNNSRENLIPLCACCHKALHSKRWKLS